MNWIHYITGPLIGAIIGYFTNFLAVKMIFRPHKAVMLGRFRLPFTPGVMPRRKGDLAHAIGTAVEESLLNRDDLTGALLAPETVNAVSAGVSGQLYALLDSDQTVTGGCEALLGVERTRKVKAGIVSGVTNSVSVKLNELDLGKTIADIGSKVVLEKVQGTMLAMFVNPGVVAGYAGPLREQINTYVADEGPGIIGSYIAAEVEKVSSRRLGEVVALKADVRTAIADKIGRVYADFMEKKAADMLEGLHVGKIIEDKINAMDIAEFEKLVMHVMKNELNMIVNLGALIGLVLGVINIFL